MTYRYWFPDEGEAVEDARPVPAFARDWLLEAPAVAEVAVDYHDERRAEFSASTVVSVVDEDGKVSTFEVEGRMEKTYTATPKEAL